MPTQNAAQQASLEEAYNELPYERKAYPLTHPSHLYTIGTLFGLNPVDFKKARVLELGCAVGGNLFPLAVRFPDAYFLGIDISQVQINHANKLKHILKADNVEFRQQDIMNFMPEGKAEKFDYIICHGILSWVPEPVQEKVFEVCDKWLSPRGLAVISYNALPGWNAIRSIREMMLYHNERFEDKTPTEVAKRAKGLLNFIGENAVDNTNYRALIQNELAILSIASSNSYLFHDHLESVNKPFYLHEFVSKAREHHLEYLGDTALTASYAGNMPEKAFQEISGIPDPVVQAQYIDFLTNRRFHSTIICRNTQKPNHALKKEQIMDYYLTLSPTLELVSSEPLKRVEFKMNGNTFNIDEPIACTLFQELAATGEKPISAQNLVAQVQKKLNLPSHMPVRDALLANGLELALRGMFCIHSDSPDYVRDISQKPVAFLLARAEAALEGNKLVTNVFCQAAPCDAMVCAMLQHLDGTRTLDDMADLLVDKLKKGEIPRNQGETREDMVKLLNKMLPIFADAALLVG